MQLSYNHSCFGCGENNPQGLKLKFRQEGERIVTNFVPTEIYQGYPGIMHGGITSTILDEVMSRTLNVQGLMGVTARLEVRFRQGIPLHKSLQAEAWVNRRKGPLADIESRILLEDGEIAAEGKARFMILDDSYAETGHPQE